MTHPQTRHFESQRLPVAKQFNRFRQVTFKLLHVVQVHITGFVLRCRESLHHIVELRQVASQLAEVLRSLAAGGFVQADISSEQHGWLLVKWMQCDQLTLLYSTAAIAYLEPLCRFLRHFHKSLPATILGLPTGFNALRIAANSASLSTSPDGSSTPTLSLPAIRRTVAAWQPIASAAVTVEYSMGQLLSLAAREAT